MKRPIAYTLGFNAGRDCLTPGTLTHWAQWRHREGTGREPHVPVNGFGDSAVQTPQYLAGWADGLASKDAEIEAEAKAFHSELAREMGLSLDEMCEAGGGG